MTNPRFTLPRLLAPLLLPPLLLVGCGEPEPSAEVQAACDQLSAAVEQGEGLGYTEADALAFVDGIAPEVGEVARQHCID